MGIPGQKPKPLKQQIAEGDPRKKGKGKLQEALAAEPKAGRGLPPCPRHLKGRARAAWNFWREELEAMHLDCRPDAMMLEGACVMWARAVQADEIIQRCGITVEEPIVSRQTGEVIGAKVKNHPAIMVSNSSWRQVRAFCSEFGLSPVSRTRLAIEKQDDDGYAEMMEMLSRPRKREVEIPSYLLEDGDNSQSS